MSPDRPRNALPRSTNLETATVWEQPSTFRSAKYDGTAELRVVQDWLRCCSGRRSLIWAVDEPREQLSPNTPTKRCKTIFDAIGESNPVELTVSSGVSRQPQAG